MPRPSIEELRTEVTSTYRAYERALQALTDAEWAIHNAKPRCPRCRILPEDCPCIAEDFEPT